MSTRSFTKLSSSITESTVWSEPYPTRILWVAMLAMADYAGRVSASVPGLARRAGITLEECEVALLTFQQPDKYSRTPDYEGRRIEAVDGGWRLLNHAKYREQRDEETKRAADAQRQRRHRADRRSAVAPDSASRDGRHGASVTERDSHAKSQKVAQVEAEVEAENKSPPPPRRRGNGFDALSVSLPAWLPPDVWEQWVQHRREIRRPLTPTTCECQIADLGKWRDAGHSPRSIIEASVRSGWQGLFEPKSSVHSPNRNLSLAERAAADEEIARRIYGA